MRRSWLSLVLFLAFAAPAAAQPVSVRNLLAIEGKQIPLPAGDWIPAGMADQAGVVSVALVRLDSGRVAGAILAQASRGDGPANWGAAPACDRTDLAFVRIRAESNHDGSCAWTARVSDLDGNTDAAWLLARRRAAEERWEMPTDWVIAGMRSAVPIAGIQVRYAMPTDRIVSSTALEDWTQTAWEKVERGLHNRLDPAFPLPAMTVRGEPPRRPVPAAETGSVNLSQAVWKTITFRVLSTSLDFTANLVAIGDVVTAAGLSMMPIIIGPWTYLGHELAWDYFDAPAERHRELPGLGAETPWPEKAS